MYGAQPATLQAGKKYNMNWYWINIVLLYLVLLDAIGDALRLKGHQVVHHIMESLMIVQWFALWILAGFHWLFIPMYLLARFTFFDLTYNLVAGNRFSYVGNSCIWDRFSRFLESKFRAGDFGFVVPRVITLVWYVTWLLSYGNGMYKI